MGEYDIRTESDGKHEDILAVDVQQHPKYDKWYSIFDIGVIYLEYDVTFTGTVKHIPNLDQFENFIPFIFRSYFTHLFTNQ